MIDNSLIIPFELHLVESGHDQDDLFDRSVTKQFISNRFINRKHPRVHLVPDESQDYQMSMSHTSESWSLERVLWSISESKTLTSWNFESFG